MNTTQSYDSNEVEPYRNIENEEQNNDTSEISVIEKKSFNIKEWRHLLFSENIETKKFYQHVLRTYQCGLYAKKCLTKPSEKIMKQKGVLLPLPKNPKEKTLFLDLDETLVTVMKINQKVSNKNLMFQFSPDQIVTKQFRVRPYCKQFLEENSKDWDIYIFTAAEQKYAEFVQNIIDPKKEYIRGILSMNNCMRTQNGVMIKNLDIIQNKKLEDILIVDNWVHSFGYQLDNGVPILEWKGDKNDEELLHISKYLKQAAAQKDVRVFNREQLRLQELINQDINLQHNNRKKNQQIQQNL